MLYYPAIFMGLRVALMGVGGGVKLLIHYADLSRVLHYMLWTTGTSCLRFPASFAIRLDS